MFFLLPVSSGPGYQALSKKQNLKGKYKKKKNIWNTCNTKNGISNLLPD
jgi:hypothetical protein